MVTPRILRARRRARAFSTACDVRIALSRMCNRLNRRLSRIPDITLRGDVARVWLDFHQTHERALEHLRDNPNRLSYWDYALGVLGACARLCRQAGALSRCDTCGDPMSAPMPEGMRCRHCQRDVGDGGLP